MLTELKRPLTRRVGRLVVTIDPEGITLRGYGRRKRRWFSWATKPIRRSGWPRTSTESANSRRWELIHEDAMQTPESSRQVSPSGGSRMTPLVLSLFPGIGLLDMAFEAEGFCMVRGPDILWGGDVRRFHPPAGRFDGVIGGPPCQAFSQLRHIVEANGHKPKFGNLIPEFERCVAEAAPSWFLMENVPDAPVPVVRGYGGHAFLLDNRQCIAEDGQPAKPSRKRRWTFGARGKRVVLMIETAALFNPDYEGAACGGHSGTLARVDKRRAGRPGSIREYRTGTSCLGENTKSSWAFAELKRKQGLPDDFDLPPFLVEAKCKAVGNGVPLPMGRAMARAVREAIMEEVSHG